MLFLVKRYRAYRKFLRLQPEARKRSAEPELFARNIAALGPAFIKLGQILSTRPDVIPPEYISALERLQENVPPFDIAEAELIVEEELGRPVREVFASFDAVPAASASLAQVHFAVLPGGEEAAVKVQRPGIRDLMRRDMATFSGLLKLIKFAFPGFVRRTNLMDGFMEFRRYTLQELDFTVEGKVIDRFRKNFAGWDDVVLPKVHHGLSSDRVLTMERVSGMRLKEAEGTLSAEKREALCIRLAEMELKMFISDGLFHADLHPGNVFFRKDGKIVLLDFGMYGELSAEERDRFVLYWLAVTQNQVRRAFYHFRRQCVELPGADEDSFYGEFKSLADEFFKSRLMDVSITKVYLRMMRAGYRHGYLFPANLLLHAKALTTAESLAFTLMPDMRFERVTRPIIAREFARLALGGGRLRPRLEKSLPELLLFGELPPGGPDAGDVPSGRDSNAVWSEIYNQIINRIRAWESGSGAFKSIMDGPARSVLSGMMPEDAAGRIMGRTWEEFRMLEKDLPAQKTLGATFTIHLAAATVAMFTSLTAAGKTRSEAAELLFTIGWKIYQRMGGLPLVIAELFSNDPRKKMEIATQMFRWFPFGSPAYLWEDAACDDTTIAFNCTKCPVAEYFAKFGLGDICYETWCKLDYPLAEQWGGILDRSGSIAGGARVCDFRWKVRGDE